MMNGITHCHEGQKGYCLTDRNKVVERERYLCQKQFQDAQILGVSDLVMSIFRKTCEKAIVEYC